MVITNPLPTLDGTDRGPDAGFSTVNGGFGLTGMRERLLLINGSLVAGSGDGRWTVTARVPR